MNDSIERLIESQGVLLHASSMGSGMPLLWSHGLTHSQAYDAARGIFNFDSIDGRFRLIRYDARGHGRSTGTLLAEHYRWPALAEDMLAVADGWQLDAFVAGGVSMGAASALFAALAEPQRIKGLILALPPTAWRLREAQRENYQRLASLAEQAAPQLRSLLGNLPLTPAWLEAWPRPLTAIRRQHFEQMSLDWLAACYDGAASSDLPDSDLLCGLTQPSLILAWQGDEGHPLSVAERLAELLPRSELHIATDLASLARWPAHLTAFMQKFRHAP